MKSADRELILDVMAGSAAVRQCWHLWASLNWDGFTMAFMG
jgi:hypothetical protein